MSLQLLVPLAGPEFDRPGGTTKAEQLVDGVPLLVKALGSRSWMQRGEVNSHEIVFVLRDTPTSRRFAEGPLAGWFEGCSTLFLGAEANGAALSALAGVSLLSSDAPLCVDLADILYREDLSPRASFETGGRLGGIVLTFPSSEPCYSYVRTDQTGAVVESAEKKVISNLASAGTYFFRNPAVYISAVADALAAGETYAHAGRFFVCPLFNLVLSSGWCVAHHAVTDVLDVKQL